MAHYIRNFRHVDLTTCFPPMSFLSSRIPSIVPNYTWHNLFLWGKAGKKCFSNGHLVGGAGICNDSPDMSLITTPSVYCESTVCTKDCVGRGVQAELSPKAVGMHLKGLNTLKMDPCHHALSEATSTYTLIKGYRMRYAYMHCTYCNHSELRPTGHLSSRSTDHGHCEQSEPVMGGSRQPGP